jgi:hypothetical protein
MIATKFEILLNGTSIKHSISNAQSGSSTTTHSSGSEQRK